MSNSASAIGCTSLQVDLVLFEVSFAGGWTEWSWTTDDGVWDGGLDKTTGSIAGARDVCKCQVAA